jgi:ribosomal protein L25 (general stress protein Ctc)
MEGVKIFEHNWTSENGKPNKMAILWGGMDKENPTAFMNNAVNEYVQTNGHNQFIEIHMDNPWLRVIIKDVNDIPFDDFTDQRL